ncbi:uncharacterized protein KY384_008833 [Bacidia gigantensis]|uniref:uncharacterized protein n=1 Tax=Bacidia gigantensis TaxID=2732470 RepID=UPI001D04A752|nr:uncharacterized protein KY384_008833 [Bacidia gigantensis]KAG8526632.1 hypothetical protein KY384_008833 [Bacidia gigantensis]
MKPSLVTLGVLLFNRISARSVARPQLFNSGFHLSEGANAQESSDPSGVSRPTQTSSAAAGSQSGQTVTLCLNTSPSVGDEVSSITGFNSCNESGTESQGASSSVAAQSTGVQPVYIPSTATQPSNAGHTGSTDGTGDNTWGGSTAGGVGSNEGTNTSGTTCTTSGNGTSQASISCSNTNSGGSSSTSHNSSTQTTSTISSNSNWNNGFGTPPLPGQPDLIGSDVCGNGGCKSQDEYCAAIQRNGKTDPVCEGSGTGGGGASPSTGAGSVPSSVPTNVVGSQGGNGTGYGSGTGSGGVGVGGGSGSSGRGRNGGYGTDYSGQTDYIGSDVCGNGGCQSQAQYCAAVQRNGQSDPKCGG